MDTYNINLENLTYEKFLSNFKIFDSVSEASKKGFEVHHINPVAIQNKNRKDPTLDNRCIRCTSFEHTLAHYLLAKEFGDKYIYIFGCFCNRNFFKLSDIEKLTLENLKEFSVLREEGFKKIGKNTSKCLKNKPFTKEHKKAISEASIGRKLSKDTIQKLSDINSQRKWWNNGIIETNSINCPEGFISGRLKSFSEKMSKEKNPRYGKKLSEKSKNSIKEKNKLFYESHKPIWFNNGLIEKVFYENDIIPDNFKKGRLPFSQSQLKNQSESMKKLKWFNNGITNVRKEFCPDGFVPGRIKINKN